MKKLSILSAILVLAQMLLVLASWMISSVVPTSGMRSLLSSEGIRWFFGHFADNIAAPPLVWIILLSIGIGSLKASGLPSALWALTHGNKPSLRQRYALWMSLIMLLAYVTVIILLTCLPQAVLLSSTGQLFPSSFSVSIVPGIAFAMLLISIVYGVTSDTLHNLTDIFRAATGHTPWLCQLLLLYILAAQLYYSVLFVVAAM